MSQKKKVIYYYDNEVGNFYYGQNHPMKPHRMRMTHSLIINYGLWKNMNVYRPYRLNSRDMTLFHSDDYVHFLKSVTPENENNFGTDTEKFNIDIDCPIFDGVFRFCQISSGGSVGGAYKINKNLADYSINWSGGLHHAKKSEASGFCYINDIVLSILELLKYHNRVLYVDIDIHHGDGVEEAFYTTDRVMTVSFHKYGDFFPGTGSIKDKGIKNGKNYAINIPLDEGINDTCYEFIFKPILRKIINIYQPGAIVLQAGADSLAGDRLGCFNLTIRGHGNCLQYLKTFGLPILLLGGGGYTLRNVARCWTYETSICCDVELENKLPYNPYYEYFAPNYLLSTIPTNMVNVNTRSDIENKISTIFGYLKELPYAPNVQTHLDYSRKDKAILDTNNKTLIDNIDKTNRFIKKYLDQDKPSLIHKIKPHHQSETFSSIDNQIDREQMDKMKEDIIMDSDHGKDVRIPEIIQDKLVEPKNEFYENDQDNDITNDNINEIKTNSSNNNESSINNNNNNNESSNINDNNTNSNDLNSINSNNNINNDEHKTNANGNNTETNNVESKSNENEIINSDTNNNAIIKSDNINNNESSNKE